VSGATVTTLAFEGGHAKWGYPVENIFLDWSFGKAEKKICYIGHLDVVPPGDEKKWSTAYAVPSRTGIFTAAERPT